jgi:hypothetical protein
MLQFRLTFVMIFFYVRFIQVQMARQTLSSDFRFSLSALKQENKHKTHESQLEPNCYNISR